MEKRSKIMLLFSVIAFLVTFLIIFSEPVQKTEELEMDLRVPVNPNLYGVNPEGDALHFATVPPGAQSFRNFTLDNTKKYPLRVEIRSKGNISSFIIVSENDFVLEPNTSKDVKVTARVDAGSEPGKYKGKLYLIFRKPLIF